MGKGEALQHRNFSDVRLIIMTLDIGNQAYLDVSAFDQVMAKERRFREPPGKHPVEDKSLMDECAKD